MTLHASIRILAALAVLFVFHARAQRVMTKQEALAMYFEDSRIDRMTVFLTDEQIRAIQARARAKVGSKILTYYVGRKGGKDTGYAFFETQTVRTMPETYMVVVSPEGTVRAVELLAFFEPEDYRPSERWLNQFRGVPMGDDLWLKRGIQNIVGATLTAQSITEGVRRVLAQFEIVIAKEQ